jgi:hypothetical protein
MIFNMAAAVQAMILCVHALRGTGILTYRSAASKSALRAVSKPAQHTISDLCVRKDYAADCSMPSCFDTVQFVLSLNTTWARCSLVYEE